MATMATILILSVYRRYGIYWYRNVENDVCELTLTYQVLLYVLRSSVFWMLDVGMAQRYEKWHEMASDQTCCALMPKIACKMWFIPWNTALSCSVWKSGTPNSSGGSSFSLWKNMFGHFMGLFLPMFRHSLTSLVQCSPTSLWSTTRKHVGCSLSSSNVPVRLNMIGYLRLVLMIKASWPNNTPSIYSVYNC